MDLRFFLCPENSLKRFKLVLFADLVLFHVPLGQIREMGVASRGAAAAGAPAAGSGQAAEAAAAQQ